VLAEILMAGLFTEDEVERRLGLPYLGAVPTAQHGRRRQALQDQPAGLSAGQAAFQLRGKLPQAARRDPVLQGRRDRCKVIAVTSSLPGEGKTTTTFSLARTLATSGAKVVSSTATCARAPSTVPEGTGLGGPAGSAERRLDA
jgi:succinoglycan biosynthesis transport protein ExoP